MPAYRRPTITDRTTIIGRTGTGKSVFALWLLSVARFDVRPWLIIDYKGEPMLDRIDPRRITELKPGRKLPRTPGLYYMNPIPRQDDAAVADTFWHIWDKENAGILIDETVQIADTVAFESLLTQGRTKKIQMLMCTQRPVDLSTYVFTQSDFMAAFPVRRREDQRRVEEYLGRPGIMLERRPRHHALWYDVAEDQLIELTPTPAPPDIIADINRRAPNRSWWS